MPLVRPFAGLRPVPEYAKHVVAPPYDVLNSEEARHLAVDKPWSFLHISKAEIDLEPGTDPYSPAVYAKASDNLNALMKSKILVRDTQPNYYVYRLKMGEHIQTGLVAAASVKDYESNRIRKHEYTRPGKEDDRVRQIEALNSQTGPVLLAYKSEALLDKLLHRVTEQDPVYELVSDDGIGHTFWVVNDTKTIGQISHGFDAMDALYIADGHHRSAAAARVAATIGASEEHMSRYFLTVIFPHDQMKILDYNRVLTDLNGLTNAELIRRIEQKFSCVAEIDPVSPTRSGEFGMYLDRQWYRLNIGPDRIPQDPVGRLDVSLLADNLLEPVLGIHDPRTDKRIDFIGGIRGLQELQSRVDSKKMSLAFSLFPTRMEDLMAVADAGRVMPPKSTWFEPKLADGLISHMLD